LRPQIVVGFAAETEDLEQNARAKLDAKQLDLIVGNDVTLPGAGFGTSTNQVLILGRDGTRRELDSRSKRDVAGVLWDHIQSLLPPTTAEA
jgi:phosphopantothenoylcysteine decarboxylase/phosphopantothenate--cysteine ligase